MAGTRSSARLNSSSPQSASKDTAGTKRKAEDAASPSGNKAKRGRPSEDQKQKTLEETISAPEPNPDVEDEKEETDQVNGQGELNLSTILTAS